MEKLDGFPLEAVEPDFEAQEGIILNVADFLGTGGHYLRHRRELSGPSQDRSISRSPDGDNKSKAIKC